MKIEFRLYWNNEDGACLCIWYAISRRKKINGKRKKGKKRAWWLTQRPVISFSCATIRVVIFFLFLSRSMIATGRNSLILITFAPLSTFRPGFIGSSVQKTVAHFFLLKTARHHKQRQSKSFFFPEKKTTKKTTMKKKEENKSLGPMRYGSYNEDVYLFMFAFTSPAREVMLYLWRNRKESREKLMIVCVQREKTG